MAEIKYDKLDRMRADIKRDRDKVARLQEQIKSKEAKLKEAEASQIITDVGAINMSPEQLAEFLVLIRSGQLNTLLSGQVNSLAAQTNQTNIGNGAINNDEIFEEKDLEDEEDFDNEEN